MRYVCSKWSEFVLSLGNALAICVLLSGCGVVFRCSTDSCDPAETLASEEDLSGVLSRLNPANGPIRTILQVGDSLYVGGSFTALNTRYAPNFLTVDADSGDVAENYDWLKKLDGTVYAVVFSGNSAYVGGSFTLYGSTSVQNLVKVDLTTGELDGTFTQSTGPSGQIRALAIADDHLYVGGGFATYRGVTAQNLARVDLITGDLDTTFTQTTGPNNTVLALAASGTQLYIGGSFTTYRGATALRVASVDLDTGVLDTAFTQATGPNSSVNALIVSGTNLYLGGDFATYRGTAAQRLAAVDLSSGNLDTTFTQATGMSSTVNALAIAGGSLYVGGAFTTYRGAAAQRIAKVDLTSGALDTTFTQATGMSSTVNALTISGTRLFAGGAFTTYRGAVARRLAKLDLTTGDLDSTFTQSMGLNNFVNSLAVSGDVLYVGGGFSAYRGVNALYLAKVSLTTGEVDTTFTQATGPSAQVSALAYSGDSLYVGGAFTTYRGATAQRLAKVDLDTGDLDTTFTQATGMSGSVNALAVDGSLYVGGAFTTYRGTAAQRVAKVDLTSGALDTTFTQATGADGTVNALAVSGARLYLGGSFTTYRGTAAERLASVDLASGALDTTFTQATGVNNTVNALTASGTQLYVGGIFSDYRGTYVQRLISVDLASGALDTVFSGAVILNGDVNALGLGDGSLFVGGGFTTCNGVAAPYVVAVDPVSGAIESGYAQALAFDSVVTAIMPSSLNRSVYVGGAFTAYRGEEMPGFAELSMASGKAFK